MGIYLFIPWLFGFKFSILRRWICSFIPVDTLWVPGFSAALQKEHIFCVKGSVVRCACSSLSTLETADAAGIEPHVAASGCHSAANKELTQPWALALFLPARLQNAEERSAGCWGEEPRPSGGEGACECWSKGAPAAGSAWCAFGDDNLEGLCIRMYVLRVRFACVQRAPDICVAHSQGGATVSATGLHVLLSLRVQPVGMMEGLWALPKQE